MKKLTFLLIMALLLSVTALPAVSSLAESPAPDFTAADQYGQVWTLSQLRGRAVLLHLWTTWYAWCDRDLQELEAFYRESGMNQGDVVVLGVASPEGRDSATATEIAGFLAKRGVTCPVLMDTTGVIYGQLAPADLPATYFVSPAGVLLGYAPGAAERLTLMNLATIAKGN